MGARKASRNASASTLTERRYNRFHRWSHQKFSGLKSRPMSGLKIAPIGPLRLLLFKKIREKRISQNHRRLVGGLDRSERDVPEGRKAVRRL
jgi:monoamine oxidase